MPTVGPLHPAAAPPRAQRPPLALRARARGRTVGLGFGLGLGLASALALGPALAPARAEEPSLERLRKDLGFLASPALEGRGTGTAGCEKAAAYAVERFREIGLGGAGAPAEDGARAFLQTFRFTAGVRVDPATAMRVATPHARLEPALGSQFNPLGFSSSGVVESEVVFCGYGITASEPAYDDYAGIEVRGKIVLVIDGSPGAATGGDERTVALRRYGQLRYKAMNAREHGALALIVVAREAPSGGADPALVQVKGNTLSGDAGIIAVDLQRSLGERLYGWGTGAAGGIDPEALPLAAAQRAIDADFTPRSCALELVAATLEVKLEKDTRESANVLALLPGRDPALAGEHVVIGAHYDHLGHGEMGGSLSAKAGIHHGADDNASGSAAVIEAARLLAANPPRRSVVFALWSGEELGLLGSSHFAKAPTIPLAQVVAYVNLDMVGRLRDDKLTIGGFKTALEWPEVVDEPAAALGFKVTRDGDGFGPSDYSSFYAAEVPVLNLFTNVHSEYHTPEDTVDRIEWAGLVRVTSLATTLVARIADRDTRPTYQKTGGSPHDRAMTIRGPSVYLGTIPDYAASEEPGLRLAGVREGSPADKAGLRAGDLVVRFDGKEVRDVQDYTYALFAKKPGDRVTIVVRRHTELVEVVAVMGRKGGEAPPPGDPHRADPHHPDPHADPHHPAPDADPHHPAPDADPHHPAPHADPHHPAPRPRDEAPPAPAPRRADF